MAIAENQGQHIFCDDVGSGTPVVLGHSFLCTGEMWREQVRVLANRNRIINLDLRGHGRSGRANRPFSLYDALVHVPSALKCLDALMDRDSVVPRLPEIEVPSLVMVGEEDRSLPPALSRRIHEGLRDSTLRVVHGAGHLSALEQPTQVNDAITGFLSARLAWVAA